MLFYKEAVVNGCVAANITIYKLVPYELVPELVSKIWAKEISFQSLNNIYYGTLKHVSYWVTINLDMLEATQ